MMSRLLWCSPLSAAAVDEEVDAAPAREAELGDVLEAVLSEANEGDDADVIDTDAEEEVVDIEERPDEVAVFWASDAKIEVTSV
jgi:hypothetical protein